MTKPILIDIYTSNQKKGAYLYILRGKTTDDLPEALKQQLGPLRLVMPLMLSPTTTLAKADPVEVMKKIETQGFYLQYSPEEVEDYMLHIPNAKLPK